MVVHLGYRCWHPHMIVIWKEYACSSVLFHTGPFAPPVTARKGRDGASPPALCVRKGGGSAGEGTGTGVRII